MEEDEKIYRVGYMEFDLANVDPQYVGDIKTLLYIVFQKSRLPFTKFAVKVEKDMFRIKGYIVELTPMDRIYSNPSMFFDLFGFFAEFKRIKISKNGIILDVCIDHKSLGCNTIIIKA